ncbi:hypothetical protein BT93_A1201 [Corymbia citriodora subsp. variegata]|nr:hypothetical protein BT93_A1201 [Corymbia citriodora subsp. variegata]
MPSTSSPPRVPRSANGQRSAHLSTPSTGSSSAAPPTHVPRASSVEDSASRPRSFQVLLRLHRPSLYTSSFRIPPQLNPEKHEQKNPLEESSSKALIAPRFKSSSSFDSSRSRDEMMSIFSSFEALCAEAHGQKIAFSFSPAKAQPPVDSSAAEKVKKVGGKPLPGQSQPKKRAPRFAPELDGVHCFETILPY